jgi:hypothetical protein
MAGTHRNDAASTPLRYVQADQQISQVLTWELIYELREAANLAHGLGRSAQEERLVAWAERLGQLLAPGETSTDEACISHIYVG